MHVNEMYEYDFYTQFVRGFDGQGGWFAKGKAVGSNSAGDIHFHFIVCFTTLLKSTECLIGSMK